MRSRRCLSGNIKRNHWVVKHSLDPGIGPTLEHWIWYRRVSPMGMDGTLGEKIFRRIGRRRIPVVMQLAGARHASVISVQ